MQAQINSYGEFVAELLRCGFSMGGGSSDGIFALIPWSWNQQPPYNTPVRWHTGDRETDPWEWRMRVLDERSDIAYAKLFFKKSGFVTREWAAYFLAVRRGNSDFFEEYAAGRMSEQSKRIYDAIISHDALPVHTLKQLAGFDKTENSQFERALTELQMHMYITMCGRRQKLSAMGEAYGWSSTVFCTTDRFWGERMIEQAAAIDKNEAIRKITERILELNPTAAEKKISKFILG